MSEQAQKVVNKNIPEWAQGLYYSSGLMSEVLVYHDEAELRDGGKDRAARTHRHPPARCRPGRQ